MSADADADAPRTRPPEVWIAFALLLLLALFRVLAAALFIRYYHAVVGAAVALVFAAIYVALAVFLVRGAPWARLGVIGVVVATLALSVASWITTRSAPGCVALLPPLVLLVLMFRPAVSRWTGGPLRRQ